MSGSLIDLIDVRVYDMYGNTLVMQRMYPSQTTTTSTLMQDVKKGLNQSGDFYLRQPLDAIEPAPLYSCQPQHGFLHCLGTRLMFTCFADAGVDVRVTLEYDGAYEIYTGKATSINELAQSVSHSLGTDDFILCLDDLTDVRRYVGARASHPMRYDNISLTSMLDGYIAKTKKNFCSTLYFKCVTKTCPEPVVKQIPVCVAFRGTPLIPATLFPAHTTVGDIRKIIESKHHPEEVKDGFALRHVFVDKDDRVRIDATLTGSRLDQLKTGFTSLGRGVVFEIELLDLELAKLSDEVLMSILKMA